MENGQVNDSRNEKDVIADIDMEAIKEYVLKIVSHAQIIVQNESKETKPRVHRAKPWTQRLAEIFCFRRKWHDAPPNSLLQYQHKLWKWASITKSFICGVSIEWTFRQEDCIWNKLSQNGRKLAWLRFSTTGDYIAPFFDLSCGSVVGAFRFILDELILIWWNGLSKMYLDYVSHV